MSPATHTPHMQERIQRAGNFPCQSPPNGSRQPPFHGNIVTSGDGSTKISIPNHGGKLTNFPLKQNATKKAGGQHQLINQEQMDQFNEYFQQPRASNGRNQNRAAKSTSSAKIGNGQLKSFSESMNSNLPITGTLDEGLTLSSKKIGNSSNLQHHETHITSNGTLSYENGLNHAISSQKPWKGRGLKTSQHLFQNQIGRATTQMNKSQSSEQSSIYPIQVRHWQPQGIKTSQNSHTNLFADNSTQQNILQRMGIGLQNGGDDIQIHQTLSLNSDMDLNPLNDSQMFQMQPQQFMKKSPMQGPQFNQSSVTHNEAVSYSGYELGHEDLAHSDSSIWLTEDMQQMNLARLDDRSRLALQQQQLQFLLNSQGQNLNRSKKAHSQSPEHFDQQSSLQQQFQKAFLSQLRLQTQETDLSHQQPFVPSRYTSQDQGGVSEDLIYQQKQHHPQRQTNVKNSGLTQRQKKILLNKNGGVPQLSFRSNIANGGPVPNGVYNTARLSHQAGYAPSQMSGEHSIRTSFQAPLHQQLLRNQGQRGNAASELDQQRRAAGSQQVSLAQFGDQSQMQMALNKTINSSRIRSSERNDQQTIENCSQAYGYTTNTMPMHQQLNQSTDQNFSCFEKGKYSTRTNPYQNLLNSNYVGSTAPSATMDPFSASQVNSCSQFIPGNLTIGTAKMTNGFAGTLSGGTGVTQTLDGLAPEMSASCENLLDSGIQGQPDPQSLAAAYTDQVAHSLLAQIKPGILKLIQNRIEVVVQELCDEGFYDQATIMRVLESRAYKLFPENFMKNAFEQENEPQLAQLVQQAQLHSTKMHTGPFSDLSASNQQVLDSKVNISQTHELPLDRSVYSDTMVSHMARNLELQRKNVRDSLLEASDIQSDQQYQTMAKLNAQRSDHRNGNLLTEGTGKVARLNTTEKMIQSIKLPQQFTNEQMGQTEQSQYPQTNQQMLSHQQEAPSATAQENVLNTDRLMTDIRAQNQAQAKGENFQSHMVQQSDDFKVTFAYKSQNQSGDFEENKNVTLQPQVEPHLQLKQENLVSFNPNDNNLQSPMSSHMVLENIRNFSQRTREQAQSDASLSGPSEFQGSHHSFHRNQTNLVNQEVDPDRIVLREDPLLANLNDFQCSSSNQVQSEQLEHREMVNSSHRQVVDANNHENLKNEIAQIYFQTSQGVNRALGNNVVRDKDSSMSRNKVPELGTANGPQEKLHSKQQSGTFNSNIGSMFYQRTLASDRSSDLKRQHMTHNSDLIEQIGQEFVVDPVRQCFPTAGLQNILNQQHQLVESATVDPFEAQVPSSGYQSGSQLLIVDNNHAHNQNQKQMPPPKHSKVKHATLAPYVEQPPKPNNAGPSQDQHQVVSYSQGTSFRHTKSNSRHSSRQKLKTSRPVSTTSNLALDTNQGRNPSYDVRAEGSIINIKRNNHGDPEMLILSSQKDFQELMTNQLKNMKPRSRSRSKKSKRSAKMYRSAVSTQPRCQKPNNQLAMGVRPHRPPKSAKSASRSVSKQRIGIRHGNLMTFRPSLISVPRSVTHRSPIANGRKPVEDRIGTKRLLCEPIVTNQNNTPVNVKKAMRKAVSTFQSRKQSQKAARRMDVTFFRDDFEEEKRSRSEFQAKKSRSAQQLLVEKDFLKSLKSMRRENLAAKKDLQALYDHKLAKLKNQLQEEQKKSEDAIKQKLKFAKHATDVQRQRAQNFKQAADELAQIAENERQRNQNLLNQNLMMQKRQSRRQLMVSGVLSRSLSHNRMSSLTGAASTMQELPQAKKGATIFGPHGTTHKPGFSFVSKSLPRNNHHFVNKGGQSQSSAGIRLEARPKGYFLRDCCSSKKPNEIGGRLSGLQHSISEIHVSTIDSMEKFQRTAEQAEYQKGTKLHQDDFANCKNEDEMARTVSNGAHFNLRVVHKKDDLSRSRQKQELSRNQKNGHTFGVDDFESSQPAIAELRNQKSLFDATKTQALSMEDVAATPKRQSQHAQKQTLMKELEKSGARFKCTSCKARNVELELPCKKCMSLNCNADEKKGHNRIDSYTASNLSWDSSDLNSEYHNRNKKVSQRVFPSKLLQCSNELISNQARLDQIQKILFQPKQPRQKSRGHRQASGRPASRESAPSNNYQSATLPEMIDRLRKSRQNLKY